jgi:hypothetical protein
MTEIKGHDDGQAAEGAGGVNSMRRSGIGGSTVVPSWAWCELFSGAHEG